MFKALHKETGNVLAIKQVPVDTDLQEIIKEISIMQQCDSPFIVKYYGSYFKNSDLWVRTSSHISSHRLTSCYSPQMENHPLSYSSFSYSLLYCFFAFLGMFCKEMWCVGAVYMFFSSLFFSGVPSTSASFQEKFSISGGKKCQPTHTNF